MLVTQPESATAADGFAIHRQISTDSHRRQHRNRALAEPHESGKVTRDLRHAAGHFLNRGSNRGELMRGVLRASGGAAGLVVYVAGGLRHGAAGFCLGSTEKGGGALTHAD